MCNTVKQCSACAKQGVGPKPTGDFGKSTQTADGLARHCKHHARQFNVEHRKKNRDIIKAKKRADYHRGSTISEALRSWGRAVEAA